MPSSALELLSDQLKLTSIKENPDSKRSGFSTFKGVLNPFFYLSQSQS